LFLLFTLQILCIPPINPALNDDGQAEVIVRWTWDGSNQYISTTVWHIYFNACLF